MKKLSIEVNDHEICKKLEILISTSKEDVNLAPMKALFENPASFDPRTVPEPFNQYVRHFMYMVKRNQKLGENVYEFSESSARPSKKKAVKKSVKKAKKA